MRRFYILIFTLQLSCTHSQQESSVSLQPVAGSINAPVAMDFPKDGTNRIVVCEQTGKIKVIKNGKVSDKVFLDVSAKLDKISGVYSEKGLLGIAFHPKFKTNGRFFLYYSAPSSQSDHKSVIAEYSVKQGNDVAELSSEKIILQFEQPESNHNGGQLAFGPDGYLYIGSGDGGGAGDNHGATGNGQNIGTLLGKILRIDVDKTSGGKPYAIPSDNPFVNVKNAKPEIYAYGLRNPWRFSFDRKTGELFCADVGQDKYEEIDIIQKGKNYGWKIMEGAHCFSPDKNCNTSNLEKPIAEYSHKVGVSVTGGFVYRGKNVASIQGKYIFGDWRGKLFYLEKTGGEWKMNDLVPKGYKTNDIGININSFGEDESGELYILGQKRTGTLIGSGQIFVLSKG